MGFIAWVRKMQHALHECAESVRNAESRKKEQYLPPDQPIEVRAVVSYDELTVRDAKTDSDRSHATQKSIRKATWYAFFAVAFHGVITLCMWIQMIKQNKLASESIKQNERQWKAQNRPWIGLSGNVEFTKQPEFQVFTATAAKSTAIDLDIVIKTKNYGISPAFKAASRTEVLLTGNAVTIPQDQMKGACSLADQDGESEGSVIFPSGEIVSSFGTTTGQPIELTKIRRVWIAGCIAYQDGANTIHHTKFWIRSFMVPDNSNPTVLERKSIYTRFSLPIAGWAVVKTEAD